MCWSYSDLDPFLSLCPCLQSTVCEEREFTFLTVRLVGCVVEILIFIVHKYVTSNALVSGILSLPVPNLEGKVQGPIDRVCKINSHIRENLQSLGFLICEYRRDCTAPNTVSCRQSKNYDLQSVCSTCKNVEYMYRTFSVAVSVAVMLLKKGSVQ